MKKSAILRTGYVAAWVTIALTDHAHAYLDPSVMTYAIQVVAGVAVAVGAAAGIYWRKARKRIQDKLGIDENAKKEVEDDIIVTKSEKDAE